MHGYMGGSPLQRPVDVDGRSAAGRTDVPAPMPAPCALPTKFSCFSRCLRVPIAMPALYGWGFAKLRRKYTFDSRGLVAQTASIFPPPDQPERFWVRLFVLEERAMRRLSEDERKQVAALCRQYHVRQLALFGSALLGDFDPEHSDLDFLVEFEPLAPGTYADT